MLRAVVAAPGVLACLALPAGALAHEARGRRAPNLDCTGVVSGGTYANLIVPSGDDCFLSDATVLGNATVERRVARPRELGTIGGSLLVSSQGSAARGVRLGHPRSRDCQTAPTPSRSWAPWSHSVLANDTLVLAMQSATVGGSVVSNRGQLRWRHRLERDQRRFDHRRHEPRLVGSHGDVADRRSPAGRGRAGDRAERVLTDNQASIYIFDNHSIVTWSAWATTHPPTDSVGTETNTVDGRSIGQCARTTPAPAGVTADSLRADQSRAIGRDLTAPPFKLF